MNILVIQTSPRKKSRTNKLAEQAILAMKEEGATVEVFSVIDKDLKPCVGCISCQRNKEKGCILKDDITELLQKMKWADGILFAVPTYFYDINSHCKILLDRTYSVLPLSNNKVGAIITTAGSIGQSGALKTLQMFFGVHDIHNVGFVSAYAEKEMNGAKEASYKLGKKMAKVVNMYNNLNEDLDVMPHYSFGTHTK